MLGKTDATCQPCRHPIQAGRNRLESAELQIQDTSSESDYRSLFKSVENNLKAEGQTSLDS